MLKIKSQISGDSFHNKTRDILDQVTNRPEQLPGNAEGFHNKTRDLLDSIGEPQPVANEDRQTDERTQMVEGFVDVMKNRIRELQYDYPFLTTEDVIYILQRTVEDISMN